GRGEPGPTGGRLAIRRMLLAAPAAPGLPRRRDRAVPHHAVEPGDGPLGRLLLPGHRDERVLDDVLRRVAPLPGEQHQPRGVLVEQPTEDVRADPSHATPTVPGSTLYLPCR